MSSGSGVWPTFWAAVGALAAVAAVIVAVQADDGDQGTPSKASDDTVYSATSASRPSPTAAECTCVGVVLASPGKVARVFDAPDLSAVITAELDAGTKVRVSCTVNGEVVTSPVTGSTSSVWDKIPQGYIPDVMLDTVAQRRVRAC